MNIESIYKIYLDNPNISIDTRTIKKGDLFFCLKGENYDGNKFADSAISSGASYVVIDDNQYYKGDKYFLVDNVLETLQELAKFHRSKLKIPVIGITGTNGKTTTKELINTVLSQKYNVIATKGNLNNHIGVPLTILNITNKHDLAIVEMGANHSGEIADLCNIADPDFGLITNIGKAHLEGFRTINNIVSTKTALYNYIKDKNGIIFINSGDDILLEKADGIGKLTYGIDKNDLINGKILDSSPFLKISWISNGVLTEVQTQLVGNYNFYNILAAISMGVFFKVDQKIISKAISDYCPSNNRSQVLKTKKNTLILDAYNANPTSMEAAIRSFSELKSNNKVLILGDMLELGEDKDKEHLQIINLIKKIKFNKVYLVGDIFCSLKTDGLNKFRNSDEALQYFKKFQVKDSLILIKGSRGIKLEKIVEAL